ncbi:hypothetical protein [Paraglaciecola sp. MB-3u-78]|uniref:hypothetical protein n=1 Tax=Paraglaciecola sp. MB-3u-78 TaxID=2058332 RepID=UPI000C33F38F|nr:hypothetical protein [Paraglaciecola sp. MB-3u-78]PKG93020.1 hypothetical protein CXF95_29110 [Paraglaciecola sp. MB-3u-78]
MHFKMSFHYLTLLAGTLLLVVNLYGLNKEIRVDDFHNEYLLFPNDQPTDFNSTSLELLRRENENDIEFASRITNVIARGMAHIKWIVYPEEKFNQLVPIWENYFLYFMGKFSGIPEYERYHFANYHRSLERGIGICGDASMVISQVLNEQGISNKIITFPGHVVVAASFKNGKQYIFDADYGVTIPFSLQEFPSKSSEIAKLYSEAGYPLRDFVLFQRIYKENYNQWDGVEHFITKKYYFEKFAYWLKWPFPILMMFFSLVYLFKIKRTKNHTN